MGLDIEHIVGRQEGGRPRGGRPKLSFAVLEDDQCRALLCLCLGSGLGLRGKRKDSCPLPFTEPRQQHDLAIGELERVMMDVRRALVDLAKDRNGVAGIGTKHKRALILDGRLEREFGTRKHADTYRSILWRGEPSCAGAEVVCDEFFADFGWACSHAVQTVVAHIKDLLSRKPPIVKL
jgi:hypothetical protein